MEANRALGRGTAPTACVLALVCCSPAEMPRDAVLLEIPTPIGEFSPDVANAGDVNGDGLDDVLIGAVGTWEKREISARVISVRGATVLLRLSTNEMQSERATRVAAAGDTNGDKRPDMLLADPGDVAVSGESRVWLFSGSDASLLARWTEVAHLAGFGEFIAGVGDLDGDGSAEVLVGASQNRLDGSKERPPIAGRGYVRVYSGATHQPLFTTSGPEPGNALGGSACGLGDVDGDGRGDLAVGTFWKSNIAAAFIVSGADGRILRRMDMPDPGDGGSVEVACLGDHDADGLDECALTYGGRTRVISSKSGRLLFELDQAPWHLGWVGDFDHDHWSDFVVCDIVSGGLGPFADHNGLEARLYSGRNGKVLETTPLGPFTLPPVLAHMGDLDGDRVPDMLMGHGSVFVLSGARFFPGAN